jgi:hypothetical protein
MEYLVFMLALSFIAWLPLIVIAKIFAGAFRRQPAPPPLAPPPRRPLLINGKPIPQRQSWTRIILGIVVVIIAAYVISTGR